MFYKKGVLRNFAKFTGKQLCQRFINKVINVEVHRVYYLKNKKNKNNTKTIIKKPQKNSFGQFEGK